jgi:hypothetical protein
VKNPAIQELLSEPLDSELRRFAQRPPIAKRDGAAVWVLDVGCITTCAVDPEYLGVRDPVCGPKLRPRTSTAASCLSSGDLAALSCPRSLIIELIVAVVIVVIVVVVVLFLVVVFLYFINKFRKRRNDKK